MQGFSELNALAVVAGIALFVGGVYYAYSHLDVLRLVSGTPTTDVRAIDSPGLVELKGRVTEAEPIETTVSGEDDAVVSAWRVDDWDESGRGSSWETQAMGVDSGRFVLDDGTASVTVDPPQATDGTLTVDDKIRSYGGDGVYVGDSRVALERFEKQAHVKPDEAPPEHAREFVSRQPGVDAQSGGTGNLLNLNGKQHGERRYFEGTIAEGDDVYVLGHARAADDATHPLKSGDVAVGPDPDGDDPFVVSTVEQDALIERTRGRIVLAILGAVLGLGLVQ